MSCALNVSVLTQVRGHGGGGGLALMVPAPKTSARMRFFDHCNAVESSLAWKLGELTAGATLALTAEHLWAGSGPGWALKPLFPGLIFSITRWDAA